MPMMLLHVNTLIYYNTAARGMTDIRTYTHNSRGRTAPEGEHLYISQIPSKAVL